jgi:hypothetical protein
MSLKFKINPEARQGSDFEIYNNYVVIKNKKALTLIYMNDQDYIASLESLSCGKFLTR